jgi:hypothetical protein
MGAVHRLDREPVGFEMDIDVVREQFHVLENGGKHLAFIVILELNVKIRHFTKNCWFVVIFVFG